MSVGAGGARAVRVVGRRGTRYTIVGAFVRPILARSAHARLEFLAASLHVIGLALASVRKLLRVR